MADCLQAGPFEGDQPLSFGAAGLLELGVQGVDLFLKRFQLALLDPELIECSFRLQEVPSKSV